MLLKQLYEFSLEEPHHWFFFIGAAPGAVDTRAGLRVDRLDAYIHGFRAALRAQSDDDAEAAAFFTWLIERGEFPSQGWAQKFIVDEGGDDERAITRFFGLLHVYLLEKRPPWFLAFNQEPRPSQIRRGTGAPARPDVRLPPHIEASRSAR